jgi:tetrahydromethanopterin S-methyltransferase subunit E
VVNRPPRRRGVAVRMIIGGMLVVLLLPILAPLIVGALVTRAIHGVYVLTRRLGSDRRRHE